jgi:hypothetical protein
MLILRAVAGGDDDAGAGAECANVGANLRDASVDARAEPAGRRPSDSRRDATTRRRDPSGALLAAENRHRHHGNHISGQVVSERARIHDDAIARMSGGDGEQSGCDLGSVGRGVKVYFNTNKKKRMMLPSVDRHTTGRVGQRAKQPYGRSSPTGR